MTINVCVHVCERLCMFLSAVELLVPHLSHYSVTPSLWSGQLKLHIKHPAFGLRSMVCLCHCSFTYSLLSILSTIYILQSELPTQKDFICTSFGHVCI